MSQELCGAHFIKGDDKARTEIITGVLPVIKIDETNKLETPKLYYEHTPSEMDAMLKKIVPDLNKRSTMSQEHGKRLAVSEDLVPEEVRGEGCSARRTRRLPFVRRLVPWVRRDGERTLGSSHCP